MIDILTIIYLFCLGLICASFANVLAYRIRKGESLLTRSHCEKCQHKLAPLDLIPIVSFLTTKGKCRYCKNTIPERELLGELFIALSFVLLGLIYIQAHINISTLIIYLILTTLLYVVAVSDFLHLEVPDSIQILIVLLGIIYIYQEGVNLFSIFNILFAFMVLFVTYIFVGENKMGFADVKLAFGLGFFFNYFEFTIILLLSSFFGIILGTLYAKIHKIELKTLKIPFASLLSFASIIILIFSLILEEPIQKFVYIY